MEVAASASGKSEGPQSILSEMTDSSNSVVTEKQAEQSSTLSSSRSQPPALIQLGDIDIIDEVDPDNQPAVPSGRMSPTPTLATGTRGVLSPGPSGAKAFMSVEDVMVPSPNVKGTQTVNNLSSVPPAPNNKPTMLTALLKSGTTTSSQPQTEVVTAQSNAVQQALVSSLLNSLVNQSPIPTPATFQKPSGSNPMADQDVIATTSCALGTKVSPHMQQAHNMQLPRTVTLANAFNPSMFLASPSQLTQQQIMNAAAVASAGSILPPNALLQNMSYLAPFPTIYGGSLATASPIFTAPDPSSSSSLAISGPTGKRLPCSTSVSGEIDKNKPSSPKKPRLA